MGWRTTSTYQNLNRDYMKADTPKRAPGSTVDRMATGSVHRLSRHDGADYRCNITYHHEHHDGVDTQCSHGSATSLAARSHLH
jgi:hypothetical protein